MGHKTLLLGGYCVINILKILTRKNYINRRTCNSCSYTASGRIDFNNQSGSNVDHLITAVQIRYSTTIADPKVLRISTTKILALEIQSLMSLNIKVNHVRKSRVFHGGDQISGVVVATGPINEDVTIVKIKFKGKSHTLIKQPNGHSTSQYSDKAKFFSVVKVLFRGACKIEKGSSASWPFAFQLPLGTEPEKGNPDIIYSRNLSALYAKESHPLPPTISASGNKRGSNYKAFISYELRAELRRSAIFSRSLRKSGNLPVTQCRTQADGDSPDLQMTTHRQSFTHATSRLLPDHAAQSRSLREWVSDTFTSKAPSVSFSLSARSPMTLIEGQAIPIELCFIFDPARSTAPSPPEFKLVSADYLFKEYTHIRGRTLMKRHDVTVEPSSVVLSRHLVFETATTRTLLKSNEVIDIGATHKVALPDSKLIPTFNSYSICRSYGAHLTIKMACVGKQFVVKFKWEPVVLPPQEVEAPESEDGDDMKALSRASSMSVLSFGGAVDIGVGIVGAVAEGLGALS